MEWFAWTLFSFLALAAAEPQDPLPPIPPFVNKQLLKLSGKLLQLCGNVDGISSLKHCSCHEGVEPATIEPPFANLHDLLRCDPVKCLCAGGEDKEAPPMPIDAQLPPFLRRRFDELSKGVLALCHGEKPDTCHCSLDPAATIVAPFEDPKALFKCLPKSCTCADGAKVELVSTATEEYLDAVNTACAGDVPHTCKCTKSVYDSTRDDKAEMPFETAEDLLDCLPEECICPDNVTVVPPTRPNPEAPRQLEFIGDLSPKELLGHVVKDLCDAGSKLLECTCHDGSIFEPPFRPYRLFQCRPDSCKCASATGEEKTVSLSEHPPGPLIPLSHLNSVCPDGQPPKACSCTRGAAGTTIAPPFGNLLGLMLDCHPDKCECSDGASVKVPPESLLHRLRSVCPDGSAPLSCSHGATETPERFPFSVGKLLFYVQPKSCVCKEGEAAVPIGVFGCGGDGGIPVCSLETPYRCSKGKLISLSAVQKAQSADTCVCEEGAGVPVCSGSNAPAACPDGTKPDEAMLPSFVKKCAGREK